jgi:D-tyrosyl-tRNA(Tyr) deacylase
MRAVVQRVREARVEVDGEVTGKIERGLLVYVGAGKGDTPKDAEWLLTKILNLRVFENDAGKMDKSVVDVGGALLLVSQFTLFADVRRGNRPGFDAAMPIAEARAFYDSFVEMARAKIRAETGRFQAHMQVISDNDGPVTIWIESPKSETIQA